MASIDSTNIDEPIRVGIGIEQPPASPAQEHPHPPPSTSESPPPPIPARSPLRTPRILDSPSSSRDFSPLSRSLSLKSKSVAELSPTTAYSKSLPARKSSPRRFSTALSSFWSGLSPKKAQQEKETQQIGVTLPAPLQYPLTLDVLEKLEEVDAKVHEISEKNTSASQKQNFEQQRDSGLGSKSDASSSGSSHTSIEARTKRKDSVRTLLRAASLRRKKNGRQSPEVSEDDASGQFVDVTAEAVTELVENYSSDDSGSSSDSSNGTPKQPKSPPKNRNAQSCPRIRRGEDIKEYGERIASRPLSPRSPKPASPIANTDGASDSTTSTTKMNNFSNFDANGNMARQPPPQPQGGQMNGMNGVQQWPNVGAQSDMNVLWEYIVKLSDMHEQIRAQTQSVASGMQQIDSIRAGSAGPTSAPAHVNGVVNGLPPPPSDSPELARLQTDNLALSSKIEDLTSYISTLQSLNTEYENAISHTLDKLRPFAHSHAQALLTQKAHYLSLLEAERSTNLTLRTEQSHWQEKARECKDMVVEALKAQSESEVGYVRKIAALKADNRSLRRICGVPLLEDSEAEEEEQGVGGLEKRPASVKPGSEAVRYEGENEGAGGGGGGGGGVERRRVLIS